MRRRGFVYLISEQEEVLKGAPYEFPKDRKDILRKWEKEYAAGFRKCSIQIAPEYELSKIEPDGTNSPIIRGRKAKKLNHSANDSRRFEAYA